MLTISDHSAGCSRRELLRIGGLGGVGAGLGLPTLLQAQELGVLTGKSVVLLFQQGGPSQFETFDPKTEVPSSIRTIGGTTPTKIPGVHFGTHMKQLAQLADKFTVVRSFLTQNAGHNLRPLVGPESLGANWGVLYSRVAGATRKETGMPTNTVIFPQTVSPEAPPPSARGDLASTGPYGSKFAPFMSGAGNDLLDDMRLNVSRDRFLEDRREILGKLDRLNRMMDDGGAISATDEHQKQAFEVILSGGVARAFDLSNEDPRVVARYDTARFAMPGKWNKVNRGKKGYYAAHNESLGKLLLTARRLCEAGCGFVTVHAGYEGVWDMHADGNNLNMKDGMEAIGGAFDHAVAAFIRDCEARGLGEKILLVCVGEMGRTPRINKSGGRDHWSRLAPLLLYGGGRDGGQVIGQSTRDGGEPAGDELYPRNLISTVLHSTIRMSELRLLSGAPKHVLNLGGPKPIPGTAKS